ncbi:MAG: archaemetzincin family Zn-dependent metalloprotease [Archaeoglobaceae archaeon]
MVVIHLRPIGEVESFLLESLRDAMEEKFGKAVVLQKMEPPLRCYNPLRRQFNSTCLLAHLDRRRVTLGVTGFDIYAGSLNFVFGEAELGGSRAVVSTYRLRGERIVERLIKEATHEIGHVLGLRHCRNRRCVMSFSNSVLEVDAKSDEFCERCRRELGL